MSHSRSCLFYVGFFSILLVPIPLLLFNNHRYSLERPGSPLLFKHLYYLVPLAASLAVMFPPCRAHDPSSCLPLHWNWPLTFFPAKPHNWSSSHTLSMSLSVLKTIDTLDSLALPSPLAALPVHLPKGSFPLTNGKVTSVTSSYWVLHSLLNKDFCGIPYFTFLVF